MRVFRHLDNLPVFQNPVLTIGTFDGVHYGHQQIIHRVNQLAKQQNGESILITFHPHPRTVVSDTDDLLLLSPPDEKFDLLRRYGIDNVVVVPFTRAFSEQTPLAYIEDFLVKNFTPKVVVIGYNHRFGKNREGNLELLIKMGKQWGFTVEEISKQEADQMSVSSTLIRKALLTGDIETAQKLLGHEYFVRGIVVKGNQLGSKIGFPTANIAIEDPCKLIPDNGVYAVKVHLRSQTYGGMLNIGVRPTVDGQTKTIEVNIFDFSDNIYGELLQIEFKSLIRREHKFASIDHLIQQLYTDKQTVLILLANN